MFLIPFIRTGRAISACLTFPNNPISAIAISETISVFVPLLNNQTYNKLLGIFIAMIYNPTYANFYLKYYIKIEKIYHITELLFLVLYCSFYFINF